MVDTSRNSKRQLEINNAEILRTLAVEYYEENQLQKAEDALRLSLQYDELDAGTHCFLGDILAETGRGAESLLFYMRATTLDNQDFDAWVGIGEHFITRRKYAEAEQPLEKAVQLKGDDIPSLVSLGIAKYELRKYKKADQILRRVLVKHPTNTKALVVLGKTLYMLKKADEAEKVFSKAKRAWRKMDNFDSSKAWTDLGIFYMDIESYDRSQKALSKAVRLYPNLEDTHKVLESLYQKMGRIEDAYKEGMIIAHLESEQEFDLDIPYDDIDASIREVIRRFNDLGLITMESCSGLDIDHIDRKSEYSPFLFIELDSPSLYHHLITIADMAGWILSYSGSDISFSIKDCSQEEIGKRWDLLIDSAEIVMKSIAGISQIKE